MVAVSLKKFFFQAEDGILDDLVTGVQTCALPISELYSIYQAAKTISVGGDNIVIEDLAFSELVSDRAFRLILGALLLCRYGEVVLNLERKTEETT